ncbi:uncharacterized protein RJT21DRAFT_35439 [Scheffersomyces amazonensis]|uniref:uncharacterized protein n=1 Tax=Scheffersomyces amazonensis TaxID=1078765 RepID=UPI00315D4F61
MEFTDPVVSEKETEQELVSVDSTIAEPTKTEQTKKTEEAVEKLESEIDKAYTAVEAKFQDLWSNATKNASGLQDKYKLDERRDQLLGQLNVARENLANNNNIVAVRDNLKHIEDQLKKVQLPDVKIDLKNLQDQANTALDSLDATLEQVEKQAGKYVSSFTSFLTSMVSVEAEPNGNEEKETLFSSSNPISSHESYGSTRYDNDLFKLHTSESAYISSDLDIKSEVEAFNADSKTDEISKLLEKYPNTLTKTMNDLVPVKISYNLFWYRYFKNDQKLRDSEQKRKQLLLDGKSGSTESKGDEEDEDFTWDDDEEEEDVVDVAKEVKDPKNNAGAKASESKNSEEDDDWE